MSVIGKKVVNKLAWVCGFAFLALGFVDLDNDPTLGFSIIASNVVFIFIVAKLLGKPLRTEIESGNFTTEEAKILMLKHPGVWLGLLGSIIINFTV